jgi:single-stranded-DNA-specific exonuclease
MSAPAASVWDNTILVERSVRGKKWRWSEPDARLTLAMQQRHKLSPLTASILISRGIGLDDVEKFLQPRLRDFLPDPLHLRDMDKAVARIILAIEQNEKIVLFGDYDVDGITSTSLMWRYLDAVGCGATRYLPDRLLEGYGPNSNAIDQLIDSGHTLLICLDCGITAFEPLAHAKERGLDVIVIDHHQGEAELPAALAVVNPNRLDEDSNCKHLAAVGVTFLTLVALNSALKNAAPLKELPPLMQWLDLVALGTVCDVMALRDINRAFVTQGLKILATRQQIGLCALMDQVKLDQVPTAYHAGYILGPRLNAAGRIASSHLGAELLCTDDVLTAQRLALQLEDNNRQRQEMEKAQLSDAVGMVAAQLDKHDPVICIANPDYHAGLIGLLASRLKENFQRPAIVIALEKDNGRADHALTGKASSRSMPGIDLGQLVLRARQEGLILQGGGHAMAAGFKLEANKIDALHDFFKQAVRDQLKGEHLIETVTIDGIITCNAANIDLAQEIELLEPFGQGNPTPKMVIKNLRIQRCDILKDKHLRVYCIDDGGGRLTGMAFNSVETPLGQALLKAAQDQANLHVMGSLRVNAWQGRLSAQFTFEDATYA